MAPFKKIKTYGNLKTQKEPINSESFFNEKVTNLTKILGSDMSHDTARETTFDKLLKGKNYNEVVFVNFAKNKFSISGELSHSILDYTINETEDIGTNTDKRSKLKKDESLTSQSYASFMNQSDHDNKSGTTLDTHSFKSQCSRSPIFTRSKVKFQSSSKTKSDTEGDYRNNQIEFLQTKRNIPSSQHIEGTNSFLSTATTQTDSLRNFCNVSKCVSMLKQSEFAPGDEIIKKRKYQNHLHLNVSGFKFELLMNKGSTPVLPSFVKIRKQRAKHKFKTFRSIKNPIPNASIQTIINSTEQSCSYNKDNTPKEKNTSQSTSSFVDENISNVPPTCEYEIEKMITSSPKDDRLILKDSNLTEKDKSRTKSIENPRANILSLTTIEPAENSLIKQGKLNAKHSQIVNDRQNLIPCQKDSLPNQSVSLTSSTPLRNVKNTHELIYISSDDESDFCSNILQLKLNNQLSQLDNCQTPLKQTNYETNPKIKYFVYHADLDNTDQSYITPAEMPNSTFLHEQNDNTENKTAPYLDEVGENERKNICSHSQNEPNQNKSEIGDKHIDNTNINKIESHTCLKEINSDSTENSSENNDIVDSSITYPEIRRKYVSLAAGKKFRRSIIIHKNTLDLSSAKCFDLSDTSQFSRFRRRTSIKVVPVTPINATMSELESYAANVSVRKELTGVTAENNVNSLVSSVVDHSTNVHIHTSARDIVLQRCCQTEPLNFEASYPPCALQHCQKIGEGVYGEVFMFRDENTSLTVMKIIPIEGDQIVNLEKQKTFDEIISEIIITSELSHLRRNECNSTDAFTEVKRIRCVQGCYPRRLLELWDLYDENKNSENDSPEIFRKDQLYIVLELSNGGRDLEAFEFRNAQQALAIFYQIACAISVAEEELQFEHRDLHWGNVLVEVTNQEYSSFALKGKEIIINNKDVKATIIDFTLSRIKYDGVVIFNDLASDQDLFSATGDYQFEIYRLMQKSNCNNWQSFRPFSNILWLHYILDKAIIAFRYKNVKSKLHKSSINKLKEYKNKILDFQSVTDFVMNDFVSFIKY